MAIDPLGHGRTGKQLHLSDDAWKSENGGAMPCNLAILQASLRADPWEFECEPFTAARVRMARASLIGQPLRREKLFHVCPGIANREINIGEAQ